MLRQSVRDCFWLRDHESRHCSQSQKPALILKGPIASISVDVRTPTTVLGPLRGDSEASHVSILLPKEHCAHRIWKSHDVQDHALQAPRNLCLIATLPCVVPLSRTNRMFLLTQRQHMAVRAVNICSFNSHRVVELLKARQVI